MNLDDELRAALRREDPSPGFAERVVAGRGTARVQSIPVPKTPVHRPIHRMIWAAAIAAILVIGFTASFEYREMRAERASQDAVLALRIAADKLNLARDKAFRREN